MSVFSPSKFIKPSVISTRSLALSLPLTLAALALCASPAAAKSAHFTFIGVGFLPEAEQAPAAQAFFDGAIAPGTPMATAVKITSGTQAYCHRPSAVDSKVRCTFVEIVGGPEHDSRDMLWTVTLSPAADGSVANVAVRKEERGV